MNLAIKEFFDPTTWTLTYVVHDSDTKDAIIIDPVWNYDPNASKLSTASTEALIAFSKKHSLNVHYILETHAHADHISSSQVLKKTFPHAKVGIGRRITEVQKVFKNFFNFPEDFKTDGSQFDILLHEGSPIQAGSIKIETIETPGHTPACVSYLIGDALFTGDALFMPDLGTGRCDFPAGSPSELYHSIHTKLYSLPDNTRVFVGHDYPPASRPMAFQSTIGEEKLKNVHLSANTSAEQYISQRTARDKDLGAPRLLLPSVQINIDAGHLPQPENNEVRYLKIPIR